MAELVQFTVNVEEMKLLRHGGMEVRAYQVGTPKDFGTVSVFFRMTDPKKAPLIGESLIVTIETQRIPEENTGAGSGILTGGDAQLYATDGDNVTRVKE